MAEPISPFIAGAAAIGGAVATWLGITTQLTATIDARIERYLRSQKGEAFLAAQVSTYLRSEEGTALLGSLVEVWLRSAPGEAFLKGRLEAHATPAEGGTRAQFATLSAQLQELLRGARDG